MKRYLLLAIMVLVALSAMAESIQDGTAFDPGALRKNKFRYYGGATTDPSYTIVGGHVISVNSCCVNLWDNPDFEGYPAQYTFAATELTLNNNTTNYIVADYNGGSPVLKVITNAELITESDVVPILTIYDAGGTFHSLNWDELGLGLPNKLHQRLVKTQRYQRESGLAISLGANLAFTISEGKVWYGAKRQNVLALDSLTDTVLRVAPDGTLTPITALNNTHFYNGTTYTELLPNKYAINWVYRGIEQEKHCYIMLGDGNYNLADAQIAQPPAAPAIITSHAQLIAKVIIEKDNVVPYSVQSAFDVKFAAASITNHNDLAGLNVDDYQHLTAAELAELQAIDSNYVATSALTIILADYVLQSSLDNYALKNGDANEDFAIKHLDADTATITTQLQVGATADLDIAGDGLGNVTFNTGTATFTHNLHVEEQLSVGQTVDVQIIGDGSGNGLIDYTGKVTFANDVDINGNLNVVGSFTLNGDDILGDINTALATILGE